MNLAVISPSYINSLRRANFAQDSLESLRAAGGRWFPHIVVDDRPRTQAQIAAAASRIYQGPNITFIQRFSHGSISALLDALREARKQGADLLFIHLDDCVYVPELGSLLEHARDAFEKDEELVAVRLSDYPILSKDCTPELGNRTRIDVGENLVSFDRVHLQPTRHKDYTLWWAYFDDKMADGEYWPIAMWQAVYRAEFLERLLTHEPVAKLGSLGQVELYYKTNWRSASLAGKLAYINMQFAGLEMHRNRNWRELIRYSNEAVR